MNPLLTYLSVAYKILSIVGLASFTCKEERILASAFKFVTPALVLYPFRRSVWRRRFESPLAPILVLYSKQIGLMVEHRDEEAVIRLASHDLSVPFVPREDLVTLRKWAGGTNL